MSEKKTGWPSKLKFTVTVPTKRDKIASGKRSYFVTHPTILNITFNHNHPIDSAHALSFRDVSSDTKEKFFELFRKVTLPLQHTIGMKLNCF